MGNFTGPGGVSYTVWRVAILLSLTSTLPAADDFDAVCPTKGPVLGRVLETEELVKQSNHCVSPTQHYPALAHVVRIEGVVSLTILADREGKVTCVKLIKGHHLRI